MNLHCLLLSALSMIFAVSCTTSPLERNLQINREFKIAERKLNDFAKTNNNRKRKTRDPGVIRDFFKSAHEIIDFAQANCAEYQKNIKEMKALPASKARRIKKGFIENSYLNFQKTAYQYSHRHLEDLLQMVLTRIDRNTKYLFSLSLPVSVIFKVRPQGHKPGGSKKYESIRKKFS